MRLKRIFAIAAVLLLIGMYVSTIIFALSENENAEYLFRASIFCTLVIPAMLQLYAMALKAFGQKDRNRHTANNKKDDE